MKPLKSLNDFQNEGLSLEKQSLLSINGGADTYRYCDTSNSDCLRCSKEDDPRLQTAENSIEKCVYTDIRKC